MPRPKTKSELLTQATDGYDRLIGVIDSLSARELKAEFPFEHRDRCVRDVLAHLCEWQAMMLSWYEVGMAGDRPVMPAEGYAWKTTPQLNLHIWSKYQTTSLRKIRTRLEQSHGDLLQLIKSHSDVELFTKRHYHWTGTTSLGSYLTSALSSHYDWAFKVVRKFTRAVVASR